MESNAIETDAARRGDLNFGLQTDVVFPNSRGQAMMQKTQKDPAGHKREHMKKIIILSISSSRRFLRLSFLMVFAAGIAGCRTLPDSWQPVPAFTGKAWFNEKFQQTAFDTNGDGRIDRLRDWIGSGLAEELHDNDLDGWFDDLITFSYEHETKRQPVHLEAPAVPATGTSGRFDVPRNL